MVCLCVCMCVCVCYRMWGILSHQTGGCQRDEDSWPRRQGGQEAGWYRHKNRVKVICAEGRMGKTWTQRGTTQMWKGGREVWIVVQWECLVALAVLQTAATLRRQFYRRLFLPRQPQWGLLCGPEYEACMMNLARSWTWAKESAAALCCCGVCKNEILSIRVFCFKSKSKAGSVDVICSKMQVFYRHLKSYSASSLVMCFPNGFARGQIVTGIVKSLVQN